MGLEPLGPIGPPTAWVLYCRLHPLRMAGGQFAVSAYPVAAFIFSGRVDHAGDMAGGAHDKPLFAWQRLRGSISAVDRHDMVFARTVDIKRRIEHTEIDLLAADRGRTGLHQFVFQIGVAQIPGVIRAGQIGRVRVPVQEVKGRGRFALEVVAHHVIPDQVIGAQKAEG